MAFPNDSLFHYHCSSPSSSKHRKWTLKIFLADGSNSKGKCGLCGYKHRKALKLFHQIIFYGTYSSSSLVLYSRLHQQTVSSQVPVFLKAGSHIRCKHKRKHKHKRSFLALCLVPCACTCVCTYACVCTCTCTCACACAYAYAYAYACIVRVNQP